MDGRVVGVVEEREQELHSLVSWDEGVQVRDTRNKWVLLVYFGDLGDNTRALQYLIDRYFRIGDVGVVAHTPDLDD